MAVEIKTTRKIYGFFHPFKASFGLSARGSSEFCSEGPILPGQEGELTLFYSFLVK